MKTNTRKNPNLASLHAIRRRFALPLVCALGVLGAADLRAANESWIGNTSANFSGATNWSLGTAPAGTYANVLEFGAAGTSGTLLNNDVTGLSLSAGFLFDAGAPGYNISGNLITLNGTGGGITNNSSSVETISANLVTTNSNRTFGGTGAVVLSGSFQNGGSNVITINNTTTFAGAVDIRNGGTGTRSLTFAGTGNVNVTGSFVTTGGAGTGLVAYAGSGTITLSGSNLSTTNPLQISSGYGILDNSANNGASWFGGAITTGSTATSGTLQIKGNYIVGNGGIGSITLANTTTGASLGTLTMVGGTNTLQIKSTTAGANVLTLNAGNTLNFGLGATSDTIILGAGLKASSGAGLATIVNITGLGNLNGTTQNLIYAPGGLTVGSGGFTLNTSGNFGGYTVGLITSTGTALQLTETVMASTPPTAYWSGSVSGTWNSFVGGNANSTNWMSAASSGTDTHQTPGSTTNVLFNISSGATNLTTTLGTNTTINSLEFTSAANTSNQVTIGGANTLTITPSGTNFEGLSNVGITVNSGAGTETISSTLALGGNQSWLVNNSASNPLTVSGKIIGSGNLTIGGTGAVLMSASNSYTGNTVINNGLLNVTGTLYATGSPATVSVTGSGASSVAVLGGSGLINAAVIVGGGSGLQEITGGTPTSNGTLTLSNGLTINNGGIVYYANASATGAGANYINLTGGTLVANSGALIYVPSSLSSGTYALIGGATGVSVGNFTVDYLNGSAAAGNFTLQLTSGTLQLVVTAATSASPTLTIQSSARVMINQSLTLSGTLGNVNGAVALNGTLADNGGSLTISNFNPNTTPVVVPTGTSTPYTATVGNVGSTPGANTVSVKVTDGAASPSTVTATSNVSVLQNRQVTSSTAAFGFIHVNASGTAAVSLTSPGADTANTRVTVANGGVDSGTNGITVTGGSPGTAFNGANSDTRNATGTFGGLNSQSGTVTLTTTGEGLTGETPQNVQVAYTAQVYSGKASWASATGGSWTTHTNWGDTNAANLGNPGSPGISGAASAGDTAAFNDVAGQSGVSSISLTGATASLAGLSFNSTNGYAITGGTISLQGNAQVSVVTGSDSISSVLSGTGLNKTGAGILSLSTANTYTGTTQVSNGTLLLGAATNTLPTSTILVLGDASNDTSIVVLGNSGTASAQTVAGLTSVGSGTNRVVSGGAAAFSTLTINAAPGFTGTYAGTLGGTGSQNNMNVTMNGGGTEVISGSVAYTGTTTVINGVLQLNNGLGSSALLNLSGTSVSAPAILQTSGTISLASGTALNQTTGINWGNFSGFSAVGSNLTINLTGSPLIWSTNFVSSGGNQLFFGSASSNAQVIMNNGFALGNAGTGLGTTRTISVAQGLGGDSTLLNGSITDATGGGTPNGQQNISKIGGGTLILGGSNSYTGNTTVSAGILRVTNNYGLGFGGSVYQAYSATSGTAAATTSGTLDLAGVTINKVLALNGATLTNSSATTTIIQNGVAQLALTAGGTGYTSPTITVSIGGTTATATGALGLTAASISVNTNGSTYSAAPTVTISGGGGTGAVATISTAGVITITNPGSGYTSAPTITISGGTLTAGTGFTATGNATNFQVSNIALTSAGSGYASTPTVTITDAGSGAGATATATLSSLSLTGVSNNIGGNNGDMVFNAPITGAGGGFTKFGTNTVTLAGVNTYSGATTVVQGKLRVTGTVASAITVTPNTSAVGTLAGTGLINGAVITSATSASVGVAHIAPGVNNSGANNNFGVAGTLSLGNNLTIGDGTNLDFDLGTSSDLVAVTGNLTLGNNIVLNANALTGFTEGVAYTLFTYGGTLSGNTASWTAQNAPNGDFANFASGGGVVTVTFTSSSNNSTLAITPSPISLGNVLVGATPASVTGTIANNGTVGTGTYTIVATGSANASGSGTLAADGGSTTFTVGTTGTLGGNSGNNVVVGTVGASNSANVTGSAAPVNVTANLFQTASLTAATVSGTTLQLTNAASTDGGQRAGVTVTSFTPSNANFQITTQNSGTVGVTTTSDSTVTVATVDVATDRLSGTYTFNGTVTGSLQYTDAALAAQGSVANQTWTGVSVTKVVTGATSSGTTDIKHAAITSGSSYAGYGLTSGVSSGKGQPTNPTVAQILAGTASGDTVVNMAFSADGGHPQSIFQSSDTLSLSGINQIGNGGALHDNSILTDTFVLQISYVSNSNVDNTGGVYYIGWWDATRGAWVNAIAGNSNSNLPVDYVGTGAFAGTYASYDTAFRAAHPEDNTDALVLAGELGAYGYDSGTQVAWAVLNHNSEFEVIPEPSTYAMIFSGFGMLIGIQRFRRKSGKNQA